MQTKNEPIILDGFYAMKKVFTEEMAKAATTLALKGTTTTK